MMDAYGHRLASAIGETLQSRINDLSLNLATTPSEDFAAYKQRVGHIQGLRDALVVLKEAENNLDRPEKANEVASVVSRRYEE